MKVEDPQVTQLLHRQPPHTKLHRRPQHQPHQRQLHHQVLDKGAVFYVLCMVATIFVAKHHLTSSIYAHITAGTNTPFTSITEKGWTTFQTAIQIHHFLDYSVFVLGWCLLRQWLHSVFCVLGCWGVPTVSMATPIEHTVEKGEKRSCLALFEHIQFCEQSMKRSALKYPWQLGFMADQDQSTHPKGPLGMAPALPAAVSSSDVAEAVHEELASAFDDHCRRLYCKLPQVEWDVHLDSQRSAAMAKWHKIVLADPMSFDVCRMHFQLSKTGLQGGKLQDDLRNVFSSKSTSTLHGSAGPMMRFLHFCADKQVKAFPITEEVVYAFMQHVEQSAAPTFLRSFLSSLGFALHVVGLIGAKRVLDSRRIKGLADKCCLQKKKTRSRLPLTVEELTTLEEIVLGYRGRGLPDGHTAGCFLFMVYGRTRFSDMLNVGRLDFELIYGKDNTSAGLREIDVILEAIRQGDFLPDAKRSEMFPHAEDAAKLLENQDQSGF